MIKLPFNVTTANAETIVKLMVIGVLEVGEGGLKVNENFKMRGRENARKRH